MARKTDWGQIGLVAFAVLAMGISSYFSGVREGEQNAKEAVRSEVASSHHCQIISLRDVRTLLQRPALTELTSSDSSNCAFSNGAHTELGVSLEHDKHGKSYEMNQRVINGESLRVGGAERAFWGAKRSGIFIWKNGKFAALIGPGLQEMDLVNLAASAASNM